MTNQQIRTLKYLSIADIKPDPRNPRAHKPAQIRAIANSIRAFGFNAPILIDRYGNIIAGHGRYQAALLMGLTEVPVICLDDLTESQARAYKGAHKHAEFAMASGEMTPAEFMDFLAASMARIAAHTATGGIAYICMDFRHMVELQQAAQSNNYSLLNLCVWVKTNGGMGSFYRSQHELVFVFAQKGAKRINNIQLGRFGRNRTNVWHYAGANVMPPKGGEKLLALHPTVKPIMLVADAMRDSTKRGDIVLDPFLGSGTGILAAERCGRRCYGIELDPLYVDTAIGRWERLTGRPALHASGRTFSELKAERGASHE